MKKIFTLIALLAFFLGAKAETVVDLEIDNNFTQLQLISYMIFYMFQCYSPKSSHPLPLPLPQSP